MQNNSLVMKSNHLKKKLVSNSYESKIIEMKRLLCHLHVSRFVLCSKYAYLTHSNTESKR